MLALLIVVGVFEQLVDRRRLRGEIENRRQWSWRRRASRVGVEFTQESLADQKRKGMAIRQYVLVKGGGSQRLPNPSDLALMALEVSSRLRAGGDLHSVWQQTWCRHGHGGFAGLEISGAPKNLLTNIGENRPGWYLRLSSLSREQSDLSRSGSAAIVTSCRFSFLSGAPLATVLEKVAEGLTQATSAREAQNRAFAGPKLAAQVLTALPFVAVAAGQMLGLASVSWFFDGGVGTVVLFLGLALSAAGHVVSQRMIARARERSRDEMEATILCDLAGAGLQAGTSIPGVLRALGQAQADESWSRVAGELVMGSPWEVAWDPPPPRSSLLERGLQLGWEEGVSPLMLLVHLATESRKRHVAMAEEEAARLSVKLVIPLGLFLLPAFVFLGILPAVFGLINGQSII